MFYIYLFILLCFALKCALFILNVQESSSRLTNWLEIYKLESALYLSKLRNNIVTYSSTGSKENDTDFPINNSCYLLIHHLHEVPKTSSINIMLNLLNDKKHNENVFLPPTMQDLDHFEKLSLEIIKEKSDEISSIQNRVVIKYNSQSYLILSSVALIAIIYLLEFI